MASLSSCPACNTSLTLFTPREVSRHVNACLDAQSHHPHSHQTLPTCLVCQRDLTPLTPAARAEHQNRCLDNLNSPPKKKISQKQTTLAPNPSPDDKRLRRFLELLGLERYAQRFTDQEVDFQALRLLEDTDFARLRIPDAARRRIADALTAVPILAQIDAPHINHPALDPALVPTQRFGTSKLAHQMQRNKPMVQLDDSDGEYAPTPIVEHSSDRTTPITDKLSNQKDTELNENATNEERSGRLTNDEPNYFDEIEQIVKSGHVARMSEDSDVSSIASDPEVLAELLRSTSQISIELKIQKWRKKQIEKEKSRHARELKRIETEYMKLTETIKIHKDRQEGQSIGSPRLPNLVEQNCDTIDLTQDISGEKRDSEGHVAKVPSTKIFEKSIVISSNESVLNASSIRHRDSEHVQREEDLYIREHQKVSEPDAPATPRSPPQPESPRSEKHTPGPSKKETSSEDEVINLISTEKKRRNEQPLRVSLSPSRNNIPPLFAPTSNPDDSRASQQNPDDSDEDFMDLLGVGKENTRASTQSNHPPEDAHKRSSTEDDSSTTEEAPTQSRLKKRPKKGKRVKATSQDISQLIRMDKVLYEDILLMDSVPFDRILSRLRGGQKHVTKKALYDFLQNEGIIFKGDSVEPASQQESYLRHLNSDKCTD